MHIQAGRASQHGFTYLAVIFMVAVLGVVLAANGIVWSAVKAQEDREQLAFVGDQFRRAIGSYYEQSPGGAKRYPKRLEDLLNDDRFAAPHRHLRRIFVNPLSNTNQWHEIRAGDGGIMGVSATEEDQPRNAGSAFVYLPQGL